MTTETPPNVRGNNKQDKVRKPKRTTQQRLEASLDVAKRKYDRAVAKVHDLEAKTKEANEAAREALRDVQAYQEAISRLQDNDTPVVK